jgi:hypothetical protein
MVVGECEALGGEVAIGGENVLRLQSQNRGSEQR